ncbi:MAG: hypothetical protein II238_01250 [Alphaproteobacteria bacterium]|nr:hypothetical protein [Alphaproteobacteria bacterium]
MENKTITITEKEFIEKSVEAQENIMKIMGNDIDPAMSLMTMLDMAILSKELIKVMFGESDNDNGNI